jgi:restriction endonuclease
LIHAKYQERSNIDKHIKVLNIGFVPNVAGFNIDDKIYPTNKNKFADAELPFVGEPQGRRNK